MNVNRKLGAILPLLLLLGAMGGANPTPALGVSYANLDNPADPDGNLYTENLAGRPVNGWSYNGPGSSSPRPRVYDCNGVNDPSDNVNREDWGMGHGLGYGILGDNIVLFYPYHGMDRDCLFGKKVYGPNNSAIGTYWGNPDTGDTDICYYHFCARHGDIGVIRLYKGNWPANLNRVYRGDVAGGANYWTITGGPGSGITCDEINDNGWFIAWNWQEYWGTERVYTVSEEQNYVNGVSGWNNRICQVRTNQVSPDHVPYTPDDESDGNWATRDACWYCRRASGSPWVATSYGNAVFAVSTSHAHNACDQFNNCNYQANGEIWATVVDPGWQAILDFFQARNPNEENHWCTTASCGIT